MQNDSVFNSVRSLIGRTSLKLDDEDFQGFLGHCTDAFVYRITAVSPELGKDMVWLEHDRAGYEGLLKMLPRHIRLKGRFSRHAILCEVEPTEDGRAKAVSQLSVFHTSPEGESRLLLSGRYVDEIEFSEGQPPSIASREVRLDTRLLGPGIHTPI